MPTPFVPTSSYYPGYSASSAPPSTWVTHTLTTVFTPPAWCDERLFTVWQTQKGTVVATRNFAEDTECYPPEFYGGIPGIQVIFSPGVCPESVPSAATTISHLATTAACCPSGMTYLNSEYCGRYISDPTTLALNAATNISASTPFVGLDYNILVAWNTKDLANFTPASAPALTTPATPLPLITSTTTHRSFPSSSHPVVEYFPAPLTSGEEAGIGIGAAAFVLAVVGAIVFWVLWRKERRKRQAAEAMAAKGMSPSDDDAKISANRDGFPEIDGVPLAELDKTSIRPESPFTEMPESIHPESLASGRESLISQGEVVSHREHEP